MHILITNSALDRNAGTELIVSELTKKIRDLGHRVTLFTPCPGELAESLNTDGVSVVSHPTDIPTDIDLIHGQHHMPTMIALSALPRVPAIYFCHGYAPWEEQPPQHPRILHYLSVAPRLRDWLRHALHLDDQQASVLPNWVDLNRFRRVREAPDRPTKAVVYANHCEEVDLQILQSACETSQIELSAFGRAFGKEIKFPEIVLPGFDIAFASGRSALEAMASGCAVIPFRDSRIAPMITPATFGESFERNFTIEPDRSLMDEAQVTEELNNYSPIEVQAITYQIREEHSLTIAAEHLLQVYRKALTNWRELRNASLIEAEQAAMANYLATLASHQQECSAKNRIQMERMKSGWEQTKKKREILSETAAVARKKLELVEKHLSRGLFRKGLLSRIESGWKDIESDSPD